MALENLARRHAERDEVARPIEPIPEVRKEMAVALRFELHHEAHRRGVHHRKHLLQGAAEEIHAAVGETRGEKADQLAVARRRIPEGEADGIAIHARGVVEVGVQALQRRPQPQRARRRAPRSLAVAHEARPHGRVTVQ